MLPNRPGPVKPPARPPADRVSFPRRQHPGPIPCLAARDGILFAAARMCDYGECGWEVKGDGGRVWESP